MIGLVINMSFPIGHMHWSLPIGQLEPVVPIGAYKQSAMTTKQSKFTLSQRELNCVCRVSVHHVWREREELYGGGKLKRFYKYIKRKYIDIKKTGNKAINHLQAKQTKIKE